MPYNDLVILLCYLIVTILVLRRLGVGLLGSSQRLVHLSLNVNPQTEHLGIGKRQYLGADYAGNTIFAIAPPPAVGQPCPVARTRRPTSASAVAQHEGEAPALRRVSLDRIQL